MSRKAFLLRRMRHLQERLRTWVPQVLALLLILLAFGLGIHSERSGFVRDVLDPGLKRITLPVLNAFRGTPPPVHTLRISMEQEVIDSLSAIRDRALEAGVLNEGKDVYFPAMLHWQQDSLPATLRLKGGLLDHLRTHKWSFRVRLQPGDTILGMETFSLQHPNTRNFTHEWLFHRALAHVGVPHLKYDLIDVHINGKDLGLHAIEQHFDSTLLARLGRGSGPILKYDDEVRIGALREMAERMFDSEPPIQAGWIAAPVDVFHGKWARATPARAARFQQGVLALEGFRNGTRSTSEVFDHVAMAKLFALSDLLGAQHSNDWRNLRFLVDSLSGKLVPIGFDGNAGEPIPAIRALREQGPIRFGPSPTENFYERLFSDLVFFEAYIAYADTFSAMGWLEQMLASQQEELGRAVEVVRGEFPNFRHSLEVYLHDRVVMRQTIRPGYMGAAYLHERGQGRYTIAVTNAHALPIRIHGYLAGTDTIVVEKEIILPPRDPGSPLTYRRISIVGIPQDTPITGVLASVPGIGAPQRIKMKEWTTLEAQ